jgi:hypothetical protein
MRRAVEDLAIEVIGEQLAHGLGVAVPSPF